MEPETILLADIPDDDGEFYACEEGENLEELTGAFAFGGGGHELLTWLPKAFDKWGVRYKIVEGAADRGRPESAGGFAPNAVLNHHTGSTSSADKPAPSLGTVINGRTDLKGPLAQVSTDFNGLTYIVAFGRANHAGTAKAAMGNPSGDGNAMYIGNEIQTNGMQKMPPEQYDAVVLVNAAIMDHFGYTDGSKVGLHHTTSTSGKWDVGAGTGQFGVPYSVTKLRADVTARLKAGPPTTTPSTEEDIMAELSPETVSQLSALMRHSVKGAWAEAALRATPADRQAHDAIRSAVRMELSVLGITTVDPKVLAAELAPLLDGLSGDELLEALRTLLREGVGETPPTP